jgi:pimeloyl-ACP methyl ester carboxylesterase
MDYTTEMDHLVENADVMREDPVFPHRRDDFTFYTRSNIAIPCQLYHTPPRAREVEQSESTGSLVSDESEEKDLLMWEDWRTASSLSDAPVLLPTTPNTTPDDAIATSTRPDLDLIFTHGKGSRLGNPAIVAFAKGFARFSTILCFDDSRAMTERVTTFRALMEKYPSASTIGGRSMGARASCRASIYSPVRKLIFFTYPLTRGLDERYEEVLSLPADADVLFIIGDEDAMAPDLILKPIRERMRARTWWIKLVKTDHAIWYDPPEKRDAICNIAGQIAAMWNKDGERDPEKTELTIDWDKERNQVRGTPWMAPTSGPVKSPTQFTVNVTGPGLRFGGGNFAFTL